MLTIIKAWALLSLLFTATWCWAGYRSNKRSEAIIRARAEELIL